MILGLDVSTSVIGICLIDPNAEVKLQSLEFLNLKREKNLFNKAIDFKEHISKYLDFGVTSIAIEEPLVMYKPGSSRAQILSKLSQFNGMISIVCFMVFGIEPKYYNVNTARKLAFPNLKFTKGEDRKMAVWASVAELFPRVEWLYGPKNGKLVKTNFDMADAAVVALAHEAFIKEQQSLSLI